MSQHLPAVLSTLDDVIYAVVGSWMLTYILNDPAFAAALAAGLVLVIRGLGALLLSGAKYLQARTAKVKAEIKALEGDAEGAKLEVRVETEPEE